MIIQFNKLHDSWVRQLGHKLFYHWNNGTIPTDQQILDLVNERYASDYVLDYHLTDMFINTSYGKHMFEVFPIFCKYDKNKIIEDNYNLPFDSNGWYDYNPYRINL